MYQKRLNVEKLLYSFLALEIAVFNDSENSLPSKEKKTLKEEIKLIKIYP